MKRLGSNHRTSTVLVSGAAAAGREVGRRGRGSLLNSGLFSRARAILVILLAVASLSHFMTLSQAEAATEARCGELGSSCICSEPFNMTGFTSGPDFWNPNDTTSKECSVEAASTGGALVRTSQVLVSSDPTAMAARPAGATFQRFARGQDNHEGTFYAGNGLPVSASLVRLAARFYIYHTPTFDYEGEGSCRNSKQTEFDGDSRIDYNTGAGFHTYNYLQFSPAIDCCVSGPSVTQPSVAGFKGKWVRHEVVLTNRSGPGYRMQSFMKNVTNNTPEVAVIDTALDSRVNNMRPPMLMSKILSNNHRWSNGATCRGWIGLSHYMMAGWTSNSGQRIGPAFEVEGGGAAIPPPPPAGSPPAAPTNPKISLSDSKMLLSGFSPIVLVATVAGLVLVRRKRRP